jgi:DNA repair exonuclease SbcCD ATPase subunit
MPQHVISLSVTNFKKIKAAVIDAAGRPVVEVAGKNAAGKSSALDAIEAALAGARAIPERPIRTGQETARIVCKLDSYTVTRTFEADGTSKLIVVDKDGKSPGGQTFLDTLTGKGIAFDPLAFQRMEAPKQLETLRRLVGLDLTDLTNQIKALDLDRADAGRDVTGRKKQIDELPEYPDAPTEEVNVSALSDELNAANQHNAGLATLKNVQALAYTDCERTANRIAATKTNLDSANVNLTNALRAVELQQDAVHSIDGQLSAPENQPVDTAAIEAEIAKLQEQLRNANRHNADILTLNADRRAAADLLANKEHDRDRFTASIETIRHELDGLTDVTKEAVMKSFADAKAAVEAFKAIDTAPITAKINGAQDTNRKIQANKMRAKLAMSYRDMKAAYEELDGQIRGLVTRKGELVAAAKFPVEGLGFGENGVTFQGLPFEQASSAEQLRVSVAMALGLAPARPDAIKVLLVRDASLLDDNSLKLITDMTEAAGGQCWLERVSNTDEEEQLIISDGGVVMVDGTVKGTQNV